MSLTSTLQSIRLIFLDTAPVIYFVEQHPVFYASTKALFESIEAGQISSVTSPITLAECVTLPIRLNRVDLCDQYAQVIKRGVNTRFVEIGEVVAEFAAALPAKYNVALPDALQLACAVHANCDAFLTNDLRLKKVTEIQVVAVSELMD